MADASSSSAEPPGFRLDRRLGAGVWEATQVELGRRVALRRLAPGIGFDVSRWPQRPGVVPLYAVTATADGTYVATRFIPGVRTLAECRGARAARRRRWLDEVEAILADVPHGDLTESDILIDPTGRVLVTGFGRPPVEADADRLERMRPAEPRRRPLAVMAVALAAAGVAAAFVLSGDEATPQPAPAVLRGATPFGSALAPGGVRTVDCQGEAPSGSSLPCTILQTDLRGRPLVVPFDGLVRGWAVRGARGPVRLQILLDTPQGFVLNNTTMPKTIAGPRSAGLIPADRSVPKGARFALEVAPGGAIGVRSGVAGAATARFFGPATADPRTPTGPGRGEELLLRVDVVRRPG